MAINVPFRKGSEILDADALPGLPAFRSAELVNTTLHFRALH